MRLRLEAEPRRLAAAADFGVLAVVLPDGDARIRQVGDGEQDVLQLLFDLCLTRVVLLNAAGDGLQLLKNSRNVLPRLLEGGDFLIFGILSGLLLLVVRYQRTARSVQLKGLCRPTPNSRSPRVARRTLTASAFSLMYLMSSISIVPFQIYGVGLKSRSFFLREQLVAAQ